MRIRNFTKMGKVCNVADLPPGKICNERGEICNVANLPPWGKVFNVADLLGKSLQCCRSSGGKVCKGEGLQYNTGTNVQGANVIALVLASACAHEQKL